MTAPATPATPVVHPSHPVLVIDSETDALTALIVMRNHQVRHLPIVRGAHCEGLVTQADLLRALVVLSTRDPVPTVGSLCHRNPPVVPRSAELPAIAAAIVAGGVDAALVVRGRTLIGIVTTTDVLAAVAAK